jgi:hypothetical protein
VGSTGLKSIFIDEDSKRYYPNGRLASHILGFTVPMIRGFRALKCAWMIPEGHPRQDHE